jgi:hypothetical protein
MEERTLTPGEVLKLKELRPHESLEVTVEGVPSKPIYLFKENKEPLGIVFSLDNLECGISHKYLREASKFLKGASKFSREANEDSLKFDPLRIRLYLEILGKDKIPIKFVGNYNTTLNILEVDYDRTVNCVEEAYENWHEEKLKNISDM